MALVAAMLPMVPVIMAPPGAVHVLFTITVLSTDGSNWILQVRVRPSPSVMTWLGTAVMVTVGGGTGEEGRVRQLGK